MTEGIAWSDGHWGTTAELSLPLDDRGLQLADGLFETVLIRNGQPCLLDEHLQRWCEASALLGLDPPPARDQLMPLILEAAQRGLTTQSCGALRLNWSRGSSPQRGIAPPLPGQHRFWLTLQPWEPNFKPISAIISRLERRNCDSLLSRCKTFAYGQAVQARREATQQGCDDALLLNTRGELCCSTTANLLLRRGDDIGGAVADTAAEQWLPAGGDAGPSPAAGAGGGSRPGREPWTRRSAAADQQPQLPRGVEPRPATP